MPIMKYYMLLFIGYVYSVYSLTPLFILPEAILSNFTEFCLFNFSIISLTLQYFSETFIGYYIFFKLHIYLVSILYHVYVICI